MFPYVCSFSNKIIPQRLSKVNTDLTKSRTLL
nr:MAG TPA: hypothetical protein [Caudoviricetes sp.]